MMYLAALALGFVGGLAAGLSIKLGTGAPFTAPPPPPPLPNFKMPGIEK